MTESIFAQVAKEAIRQGQPILAKDIMSLFNSNELKKQRIADGHHDTSLDIPIKLIPELIMEN